MRRSSRRSRREAPAATAAPAGSGVEQAVQRAVQQAQQPDSEVQKLKDQHNRELAVIEYQHNHHVRSIKQAYELKIQKLKEEHAAQKRALQKDVTDKNRDAVEQVIQTRDMETNQQIERLRHELAEQVAQQSAMYEEKVRELQAHRKALATENDQLREENVKVHDVVDELAVTKAQLKAMKKEYQANMHDLQNALNVSKEHLQVNYELISSLKADKQKLAAEVDQLSRTLVEHEAGIRSCAGERKELERLTALHEVDTRSYKERMNEILAREKAHSEAAQSTQETIGSRKQHIEQCSAAIRQAQEQIEIEKAKHLALRQDYEDHAARVTSLTEALERCKQKHISTAEILKDMSDRYAALKAKNAEVTAEYTAYRQEHELTHQVHHQASMTPQEAEEHSKRMHNAHNHAFNTLEACGQKNARCIEASRKQEAYIAKLEDEIRKALRVIRGKESAGSLSGDELIVREHALRDLKRELDMIKQENASLKDHIKAFADHQEVDERMAKRHSHLKAQHARAMQWIEEMKQHHKDLHDHKDRIGQDMEITNAKLNAGESDMQRSAAQIRDLERQTSELRDKAAKCLYPGEKERLDAQINELIRERNALRDKMSESTTEHAKLHQKLQSLAAENEQLRVIKQRYEMDANQMQKIVAQSSELNVELVNARRLLDKKEKQLELLSGQLATMLQRVKTLEERETALQEKLKQSSSPEEVEAMMGHLSSCRSEMKSHGERFAAMKAASDRMREQIRMSEAKISSLLQVIKETESAQQLWQKERQERERLQEALKSCSGRNQSVGGDQLQQRLAAMEQVYQQNMQSHEKMMAESNARIAELQNQLMQASVGQKQEMERYIKPEQLPLTKDERVEMVEKRSGDVIQRAKQELAELTSREARAQDPVVTTRTAIEAAKLESVQDLQRLKAMHQQTMRDKERQIMSIRDQTYDNLLQTLDVSNRDPNIQQDDLYAQIRDIRVKGAAREQQVMADMLRLRAINARLAAEYQAARMAQAELLHRANVGQRNQILQLAGQAPPSLLQQNTQAYQALMGAHRDYITLGSRDVGSQLAEQTQYIRELERQAPKMDAIVNNINTARFPNLDVFKNQVDKEKTFTVGAINFERKEAIGQDRTMSALESQLKAADASVRAMTDMVKRYVSQPTSDNLTNLRSLAQMSPGQIQEESKRAAELQDRSVIRSQAIIQPRRPQDGPPGTGLAADVATGEIQTKFPGAPQQTPPTRTFFSGVSMFGEPTKTFAPTVERGISQLQNDQDLIVLTYSFELSSGDRPLKYVLFEHALKAIFPRIQQLTRNGSLEMQLVKILPGNVRQDVFGTKPMPTGCTYNTCNATKVTVNDVNSIDKLVAQLKQDQFGGQENENHMVLSIGPPGATGRIHVTDVLFYPTKDVDNPVPTLENIRLLDGSWRNYLVDVLQKPKSKIDLIFNVIPHAEGDSEAQEANARLMQVMSRVETYLKQVKGVAQ